MCGATCPNRVFPSIPYSFQLLYGDSLGQASMKLLIVEDNASTRRLIRTIVAGVATQVYECADGAEALASYIAHRPDFVLMDLAMQRMDGITATRQIRASDPTARIIIVTQYDEADLREEAKAAGACGYVRKENLLEVVQLLQEER